MEILLDVTHCYPTGGLWDDGAIPPMEFVEPIGVIVFAFVTLSFLRRRLRAKRLRMVSLPL